MIMSVAVAIAKYTPERVDKILNVIRAGNYSLTAARFAGVSKQIFEYWMDNYPDFAELVHDAEAAAEVKNVAIVQVAAQKRWTAAAWWLERQFPERWGKVDRVEMYLVNRQAQQVVDELRDQGINTTVAEILQERDVLMKRHQNALPSPQESDKETQSEDEQSEDDAA